MKSSTPSPPFRLDSVVPLKRQPSRATVARRVPSFSHEMSRRSILKGAVIAVSAVGLNALGIFPPARQAFADGYDIKQDCNGGGTKGSNYDGCTACCCSSVCNPECGPCCTSGECWHKDDGMTWWLRPNDCVWTGGAAGYDGWKWKASVKGCGPCGTGSTPYRQWRCHDGYTRLDGSGQFKSACKKGVACLS